MRHPRFPIRAAALALAFVALGTTGCKWFGKTNQMYAQSPEARPLEVPPDLDAPRVDSAMALPPAQPQSVTRSTMSPASSAAAATSFVVAGNRDEIYGRIGQVLAGVEGVNVTNRAQLLGAYDVDYGGSTFLVRAVQAEGGVQVSAVDARGLPAAGEAPAALVARLRQALGAGN